MRLGIKKQINLFCSALGFHYICTDLTNDNY